MNNSKKKLKCGGEIANNPDSVDLDSGVEMEFHHHFPAENVREVWLNIFEKLNSQDKLTFSQTCSKFHDWVESKRNLFLFPEIAPTILQKLPKNSSLQCRQLCKSWTNDFDHHFQAHPCNQSLNFETTYLENRIPHSLHTYFGSEKSIVQFMNEMGSYPGNPFPGRHIHFGWDRDPTWQRGGAEEGLSWIEFWTTVEKMLETFGSHIHCFSFHLNDMWSSGIGMISNIRTCLLRLPHLRKLSIFGELEPVTSDEIQDFFRINPLPRLANLETYEAQYLDRALNDVILISCCVPTNMKRLSLYSEDFGVPEVVFDFVNLEVLKAALFPHEFERLISLPRKLPLKEVDLNLPEDDVYFRQVFMGFTDSLVQLRVGSARVKLENELLSLAQLNVNLPKLKRLELHTYWGPFHFLKELPSLVEFKIRRCDEDLLTEADIWRFIPTLQTLYIGFEKYERRVYEQLMRAAENDN